MNDVMTQFGVFERQMVRTDDEVASNGCMAQKYYLQSDTTKNITSYRLPALLPPEQRRI